MNSNIDIGDLVRDNIRELVPYSSARDEFSGSASIFLDANENPHNYPLNRYPDPLQLELKTEIARLRGQPVENLFLGNGSDEGIDLLFRVLCEPREDNVIIVDPTYGMYGVCAKINDIEQRRVLLNKDFSLEPRKVISEVDNCTKLIFLCSPNNPTSNSFDTEAMIHILDTVNCMVVVDEAYIDFSQGDGLLSLVPEKKNLVVLQTLSKAWGLAGIRLGMVFAHPELIGYLSRVKYPYNINALTIEEGLKQLRTEGGNKHWIDAIHRERNTLEKSLNSLAFVEKVFPTDANFLLVKMNDPGAVYSFLMERGIIVRDRSHVPLCEGCLRITVGTASENQKLNDALLVYAKTLEI